MKTSNIVISVLVIILIVGFGFYIKNKKVSPVVSDNTPIVETPPAQNETPNPSIKGCYVANLAKDVYTLNIQSEDGGNITGVIAFNNYEKDSSSGTFTGTFSNDILLGNYSFESEGMHSERQLIFKKVDNNFVEGFGDVTTVGNKEMLKDVNSVTYDPKSTFVRNANCTSKFTSTDGSFTFNYNAFF